MNRSSKDSFSGGRSIVDGTQQRRWSISGVTTTDTDENLDLFSRNRQRLSLTLPDESDVSLKLWRVSVGSAKPASNKTNDLLSSVDGGKHDYDWLLTPPGTPLVSSSDASEPQPTLLAPRSNSSLKSVSATKASRLSATQSESCYSTRPIRSSSVTHSSISSAVDHNTYSSNSNRSSPILNTSSVSVTSSRPSIPTCRSSITARPLTSSANPVQSRSSTSVKTRPASTSSYGEKARVTHNPRPLMPTARPQTPGNVSYTSARSNSRPSTPTRWTPNPAPASAPNSRPSTPTRRTPTTAPASAPAAGHSFSAGQVLPNGRIPATASRGSSPAPRARLPRRPIVPPDFPHETPPNLRTTLPDRTVSAGRSRPGITVTVKGNSEASGPVNLPRRQPSPIVTRGRQPSPIVTRGRLPQLSARGRLHANGHDLGAPESQKTPPVSEPSMRKPPKFSTATEDGGFGRTISKNSLDMALRHMDIRRGTGSIRSQSGATPFPHSNHSSAPKSQPAHTLDPSASVSSNNVSSNGSKAENGNCIDKFLDGEADEDDGRVSAKLSEPGTYESSRYDALLLKEDLKNTKWLLSVDDTSDQEPIFDNRFETLPEPFGLM